jgi:hypothetical protein
MSCEQDIFRRDVSTMSLLQTCSVAALDEHVVSVGVRDSLARGAAASREIRRPPQLRATLAPFRPGP